MNLKSILLSSVLALNVLLGQPAMANDPTFSQDTMTACRLEGADEWRAKLDKPTALEQEILDLERLGCHYLASRQIDDLVEAIIADHGIILLDGAGIANGKAAQREMFKAFLGAGYDLVYEAVDAKVSAAEDMAWAIGMVKVTSPDGNVEFSKYTSIWEKIDGRWKNVIEMRNTNGELGSKPY